MVSSSRSIWLVLVGSGLGALGYNSLHEPSASVDWDDQSSALSATQPADSSHGGTYYYGHHYYGSGGGGSRTSFGSSDSFSHDSTGSHTSRGGFGSTGHAMGHGSGS